ncbi:unnamed protein product [Protopolystoma xenopodis]|uniref:Uncharacterized protein n=1 Tax=Protopolystoma xenopodis TaxID=117903 RepID=A0A3S5B4Y9_9PLAT|nr:unnamed protein product [Protopolystoma xenopodis]
MRVCRQSARLDGELGSCVCSLGCCSFHQRADDGRPVWVCRTGGAGGQGGSEKRRNEAKGLFAITSQLSSIGSSTLSRNKLIQLNVGQPHTAGVNR